MKYIFQLYQFIVKYLLDIYRFLNIQEIVISQYIYLTTCFILSEDWSFVFKPPASCKLVGSSKYAPLNNLPSQVQPISLPGNCIYKPSWVQHMENSKNLQQNVNNNNSNNANNMNSNRNRTPTPSIPNNVHQNAGIFPPSPLHPPGKIPNSTDLVKCLLCVY